MVVLIRIHTVYMCVVVQGLNWKKKSIVPRANLVGPGKQTTCISFTSLTNVRRLLNRILAPIMISKYRSVIRCYEIVVLVLLHKLPFHVLFDLSYQNKGVHGKWISI